jgi:2-polyprenyl-6-methoxyphenol hydroxylase-like FAD-dependent oxidoreductase
MNLEQMFYIYCAISTNVLKYKTMKVLISGGGPAGLTMAIALEKKGFQTEIFESAPVLGPVGAGLAIGANAVKVIKLLGMYDDFMKTGRRMKHAQVLDYRGRVITETDEKALGDGLTTATFTIHRADLHQLLMNHCKGRVHTASRGVFFEEKGDRIVLHLADGSSAEGDFLVAADGIHSPLRKQVLPASRLRYSGLSCWRGVTGTIPEGIAADRFTETWGPKGRFGIVPIGGDRLYWFATAHSAEQDPQMRAMNVKGLQQHFTAYHGQVQRVLRAAESAPVLYNTLSDLEPVSNFAFGRMALSGDAAHATTPNLGQGACQAMEDALVLAQCLSEDPSPAGIRKYSMLRVPRTTKIVSLSWRMGKLAESQSPVLSSLRNFALRMIPASMAEKQLKQVVDVKFPSWE